jgi:PKD repeat protein
VTTEGSSVVFSGTASDPGVFDSLSYAWDLDYDGLTFTPDAFGPAALAAYPDGPAAIVAALRVEDKDGGKALDTVNVRVNNVAPAIGGVTNDGPVGEGSPLTLVVNATDVGSDTLTYAFDWENDGDFDAVDQPAVVSHIWYNQGVYTVSIRADDEDGGQAFTTTAVSAYNVAPTAVAGPEVARLEGSLVTFDGSGSSDPGIYDVLTYQWSFGDGSPIASGITATHSYADNNVYSATLTVTDDSGAGDADSVAVTILNANPVADAGDDRVSDEGVELNFVVGAASDPGADDTLTFAWDFDFDGDNFDEDATGMSVDSTYPDGPASYVVALRVRDDDYPYPTGGGGEIGEAIDTLQVTVDNLPPVAEANGPYSGTEMQRITLSGTGLDVPADVLSYAWDLDSNGTFDLAGQSVITAWNTAGVYTVTLRVTDDDGGAGSDIARVTISNAPPTADAGGPYIGDEGRPIVLMGIGSDPTNDPLTYTWDLDYDSIFETLGQVVTNTWPDDGVFTVTLRVDDGRGGVTTDDAIVIVNNVPPTADAGPDQVVVVGDPVTLVGSATDPGADVLTFEWDFNYDGFTFDVDATGQIATTSYSIGPATYTVGLRVTDDDGGIGFDTAQVTVINAPPAADAGGPYVGDEGSPIVLIGTGFDPDGDPLTYTWDLDYDSIFETPGQVVTNTWPDNGVYTVTLRVDDGRGGIATDDATVVVNNVPPTADAGPDQVAVEGDPVTLVGSATDPGADTLTFEWDFDYDGFTFNVDATGQTVTASYPVAPAIYTVALRVTDDDGGAGYDTAQVTVIANQPPTADAGGPYIGDEGTPILLAGTGFDPNGDPLTYDWDLDYDSTFETPGQVVTNIWPDDGVYTVTLQVDDGRGGVDTDDATVIVNNVPPIADAGGPYTTTVGITLTLIGTGTDVLSDILTYTWDLNDDGFFDDGTGQVVTYVWTMTGIYTVTLQVDDGDGGVTTDATTVNVNSLYPVVWLGVPYFLALSREVIFLRKRRTRDSRRPGHRQWPSDRSV